MNWNKNKISISNNLYIMCENATLIMNYFATYLANTSYINLSDVIGDTWPTVKLLKFSENQKNQIEEEKNIVNEKWKKTRIDKTEHVAISIEHFSEMYKKELIKEIDSETSGFFKRILLALLNAERQINPNPNPQFI